MQPGQITKCILSLPISKDLSENSMAKIYQKLNDLEQKVTEGLFDSKYGEFQVYYKNASTKRIDFNFRFKIESKSPIILKTYSIKLWNNGYFRPISMKTVFEICDMLEEAGSKKPDSNWQRIQCIFAAIKANDFDLANELIAEGPKLSSADLAKIPSKIHENLKIGIYLSNYKTLSKTAQLLALSSKDLKRNLENGIVPKKESLDKLLTDLRNFERRKKKKGSTTSKV